MLRHVFEAFNAGGIEAALAYVHPEIAWYAPPEWLEKRVYEGHEELRELASYWEQNFNEYRLDIQRVADLEDGRAFTLLHQRGRVRDSGLEVEQDIGYVAALDAGKVVRIDVSFSWEATLEAAGLQE